MLISSYKTSTDEQVIDIVNQSIDTLINSYKTEIEKLKARADDYIPVIKTDIVSCSNIVGKFYADISSYETDGRSSYYSVKRSADEVSVYVTGLIDAAIKEVEEIHIKNIPSIENNKIVVAKISKLMGSIGIPNTRRKVDHSSRARTVKYITVDAGFRSDLLEITTTDGYEYALESAKKKKEQLEAYVVKRKVVELREKQDKENKELEIKRIRQFALIAARYNLSEDSTERDLLNEILGKDKYLRLAHYLLKNREDCNDGCNYAEQGLNGFTIEDQLDEQISDEVQNLIDNWDGDGRVFRDSSFGYDYVFGMVKDEQLGKDYELVKSWIPC